MGNLLGRVLPSGGLHVDFSGASINSDDPLEVQIHEANIDLLR